MYICNILVTNIEFLVFARFLMLDLNIIALQDLANVDLTNLLNINFFFTIIIFLNITCFANLAFVNINLFFIIVLKQLLVRFFVTNNTKSIISNK